MPDAVIQADRVWKKFRRGEVHDSLRDAVPALVRRLLGKAPGRGDLGKGDFWALQDISFEVRPGEALGVIGPNGAGKSTLLKILSRILRPNRGRYRVRGRLRALIEVAAGFHVDLTGRENIFLNGAILGMPRAQIARRLDEIVAFAGVGHALDTPVKRYSSGMVARLGFAIAAHMDPEALLVDEVLSVGDVGFQAQCVARMREIRATGAAMIFVSHDIPQVCQLCDRVLTLAKGQVAAYGDPQAGAKAYYELAAGQSQFKGGADVAEGNTVAVRPVDAAGAPVEQVPFGADIRLRVDYDLANADLAGCGVLVKVLSPEGQPLLAASTARGGVALNRRTGTLHCRIAGVKLLPNAYRLAAFMVDRETERVIGSFTLQRSLVIAPPETPLALPSPLHATIAADATWES